MAQQCSEMKDEFTDKILEQQPSSVRGSNTLHPTSIDTLLADHHHQGPTKVLLRNYPNTTYAHPYHYTL